MKAESKGHLTSAHREGQTKPLKVPKEFPLIYGLVEVEEVQMETFPSGST